MPRRPLVAAVGLFVMVTSALAPALVGAEPRATRDLGSPAPPIEPPANPLPPEKQALLDQEARLRALGRLNPAPVPADPGYAGPVSDPQWESGISGRDDAEFPPGLGFRFQNVWKGIVDGKFAAVYAGSYIESPARGAVLVMLIDPDTWGHEFKRYPPPLPGPVRIASADGLRLRLVSEADGSSVVFDVSTRRFLS